ncbi:hypothetical protein D3C79_834000 [compost metagenome]
MASDSRIPQQAVVVQYHGGGGANRSAPATQRSLLFEQVDGKGGIADRLAAGQAARHDDGLEVTAGQLVDVAVGHQLHSTGGADLALSRRAAGGEHHFDGSPYQGVDDGNGLDLFGARGNQYQNAHSVLLAVRAGPGLGSVSLSIAGFRY